MSLFPDIRALKERLEFVTHSAARKKRKPVKFQVFKVFQKVFCARTLRKGVYRSKGCALTSEIDSNDRIVLVLEVRFHRVFLFPLVAPCGLTKQGARPAYFADLDF